MNSSTSPRPIVAEFSGNALRHNAKRAKMLTPTAGKTYAVIKADAYGHGLQQVAERLQSLVDGFAILELAAARALREGGYQGPILMLEGFFRADELREFSELSLATVVHRMDQLDTLAAAHVNKPLDVFLKINTGMNRLGFLPEDAATVHDRLQQLAQVRNVTVMTHFADADDDRGTAWQLDRLTRSWPEWMRYTSSFANSAALLSGPTCRDQLGDVVRPGIMLYGASPWGGGLRDKSATALGLAPVMTLRSEIIAVQHLQSGDRVGYGGTFMAEAPMTIGIVACGYADGYPRHASNGAPILVKGVRTHVVGRVSMDMLCCDVTDIPDVSIGSPVTLWGEGLPADDVAGAAGTIAYELFCALAPRVPRVWRD